MYYKRCTGAILVQKSTEMPEWVQWTHHSEGKTHCEECLMLDGCWFAGDTHPPCPHHPFCHCTLEPIETMRLSQQMQHQTVITPSLIHIYSIQKMSISTERIKYLKIGDIPSRMPNGCKKKSKDKREKNTFQMNILWENWIFVGKESMSALRSQEKMALVMFHSLLVGWSYLAVN